MIFTGPDDLTKIYDAVPNTLGHNDQLWWRGHASSIFELQPSVYRPCVYRPNEPTRYEKSVALHFKTRAPGLYSTCPTDDAHVDWLFLMQHYGLPTRLLDWTRSLLIGLFFAVQDPKKEDKIPNHENEPGTLWVLNPARLNTNQGHRRAVIAQIKGDPMADRIVKHAFRGKQEHKIPDHDNPLRSILAIAPPHRDERMVVQQACSTLHGTTKPLNQFPDRDDFLLKIEIQAGAKQSTRKFLKTLGIKPSVLFPDLEHLAKELKDSYYP